MSDSTFRMGNIEVHPAATFFPEDGRGRHRRPRRQHQGTRGPAPAGILRR